MGFNNIPKLESDSEAFRKLLRANGLYKRSEIQWLDKFSRFGCLDPYNTVLGPVREYTFFTKPDLHIFKDGTASILNPEIGNMAFFVDLMQRQYSRVLKLLQYSADSSMPFIPLLSNAKVSNIDLPSMHANDIETSANLYGTRIFYREDAYQSDENFDFSIDFEDSKYLEVYLFFKAYEIYSQKKSLGLVTPPDDSYIINKVLHDQISIYKFLVGEDGETLLHWSKLYGCYPKTVPRDSFSEIPMDGHLKYSIQWKASFVEDMEPNILTDFNALTKGLGGAELPIYDYSLHGVSGEWATIPYITQSPPALGKFYTNKLRWRI